MPPIKVMIVDDHPVVRTGIHNFLEKASDIQVVGEAENGSQALSLIHDLAPDVLLLDVELPDISGIEVARLLQEAGSPVRILALSAHDQKHYIRTLLGMGAAGYLMKDEVPDFILEAVRGVFQGEQGWVSRRVAAQLSRFVGEESDESKELSLRELQVLQGLVDGKTNQEIGHRLGISDRTVEKHIDSIFTKLGVSSRVEAAVLAVQESIV